MGTMSLCVSEPNQNSKEVQVNLMKNPSQNFHTNRQLSLQKSNSLLKKYDNKNEIIKKEKNNAYKKVNSVDKMHKNKIKIMEKIINNNKNKLYNKKNNNNYNNINVIKKKVINSSDEDCDIIECEEEFEEDKNIIEDDEKERINLWKQNYTINNIEKILKENGNNNEIIKYENNNDNFNNFDSYNNKRHINNNIIKMYLNNKENGGTSTIIENENITYNNINKSKEENKKLIIKSYNDVNIKKHNNNSYEITKANNISYNKNDINRNINNNLNKKNNEFNNCKIDNNINLNINSSSILKNNNINSEEKNNTNNFSDINSYMAYFSSLVKNTRKSSSLNKIDDNENSENNYRNPPRMSKYKWRLLPHHHKCKTQVYNYSPDNKSLLLNENKTQENFNNKDDRVNNSMFILEIQKEKEAQDKIIKSLENKIKILENKIKEEKRNKSIIIDEKIEKNILLESQKDFRIKKLEEQLTSVKKSNKLNKTLLKKKDEQIKNLKESKNKQDELIKQYEIIKTINNNKNKAQKNNKNKNNKLRTSYNNLNNNLFNNYNEASKQKLIISDFIKGKNLSNSMILKSTQNEFIDLSTISYNKQKITIEQKEKSKDKENSIKITNQLFDNNTNKILDLDYYSNDSNISPYINPNINSSSPILNSTKKKNKNNNSYLNNSISNKNSGNITYNNYCNNLSNKSKKKYSNKITLNKMKINKLNQSQKISLTNTKKKELNINPENDNTLKKTKSKKRFSFTKSKKLIKKKSEKELKEMYLQAGTVQNEENVNLNTNTNVNNNVINTNSDLKYITNNEILSLTHKNSFSISHNITTSTNKNNNWNNYNNKNINYPLSPTSPLSPMLLQSSNSLAYLDNLSLDEKFNLSSININLINTQDSKESKDLKSISNSNECDKNLLYKKLWNEGYLKYKNKIKNSKSFLMKLNFCMTNELIEIKADKDELMTNAKNKFLDLFFSKKKYAEYEKKYIENNLIFLKKDGLIIDINKKIKDNKLKNNEIIVPILNGVI